MHSKDKNNDTELLPSISGIQRYFADIKLGTIRADDSESHTFKLSDWSAEIEPIIGQRVVFDMNGSWPVNIRLAT